MANGIFDPQEVMQQLIASGLLGNTFNERWGNMPDTFAGRWGDMSSSSLARNQGTQDPVKAMRQMEANQRVSDAGSHFIKGLLDYYKMPGNAAQGLYTPPQADPNVLSEYDVEARNQGAERMLRGAPQMALETLGIASPFVARETAGAVGAFGGKLQSGPLSDVERARFNELVTKNSHPTQNLTRAEDAEYKGLRVRSAANAGQVRKFPASPDVSAPTGKETIDFNQIVSKLPDTAPFQNRIAIGDAYNSYAAGTKNPVSLDDFKKQLVAAHGRGDVSLARLDLPEHMNKELRTQSVTLSHGDDVHFIYRPNNGLFQQ